MTIDVNHTITRDELLKNDVVPIKTLDKYLASIDGKPLPEAFLDYVPDNWVYGRGNLSGNYWGKYYHYKGKMLHDIHDHLENREVFLNTRNELAEQFAKENRLLNKSIITHYMGKSEMSKFSCEDLAESANYVLNEYVRDLHDLGVINFGEKMQNLYELQVRGYKSIGATVDEVMYRVYFVDKQTGLYLNQKHLYSYQLQQMLDHKFYVSRRATKYSFMNFLIHFQPHSPKYVMESEEGDIFVHYSHYKNGVIR